MSKLKSVKYQILSILNIALNTYYLILDTNMKIEGKLIASKITENLKKQIVNLRSKKIIPNLVVIFVGNDPASATYVKRKEILAKEIGVKISIIRINPKLNQEATLKKLVQRLNQNASIHGVIIQRPVPLPITTQELNNLVVPAKDVDGLHPSTSFTPPVALAVTAILEYIFLKPRIKLWTQKQVTAKFGVSKKLLNCLQKRKILIIGRGETAGKPIADTLIKMGIKFTVAHSRTDNLIGLCLSSNIIISCVGKANIVRPDMVKNETILIGVGLHPENEKLQADYIQEEIAKKVAFYTPVPGGVGPVNVACLYLNLLQAAKIQTG